MIKAYTAIKTQNSKLSIRKAAKLYGVPYGTLRDRVNGSINPECVFMGKSPELSIEQEARLVTHLNDLAVKGYAYTRQGVVDLASNYAAHLHVRDISNPFSLKWFYSFIKRWPDLRVLKPRSLTSDYDRIQANLDSYLKELSTIIQSYDLEDKPHLIYNVAEIILQQKPLNVADYFNPSGLTSESLETTTIIGCGSASGALIPPYFVFVGKQMQTKWMDQSSSGADGSVSESGKSNSQIFIDYLKHHFLSFVPANFGKLILLLDGHKSHISIPVIDWAKDNNIILQILPSYFLQPMDVGVYKHFREIYNSLHECHKKTKSSSSIVTNSDVCQLACAAYLKSCTPENLQSAFRKSGIYPLIKDDIDS